MKYEGKEIVLEEQKPLEIHDEGGGESRKLSFAAVEAYKMLRTKINLMLPRELDSEGKSDGAHFCRIIGVTSALRGEGKSTTATNLAKSMAQAGQKVCIVEADMRLPNLSKRFSVERAPGLSNILTGQCSVQQGVQRYVSKGGTELSVITAGDIPPTPSELLESRNMEILLKLLSEQYDYIIVDLPPVTLVTDAIAVSKLLDGMILVVRQNYCDKRSLRDVLYQFKLTDTKVVGLVFNCSEGYGGSSAYYRKDRRYGKKNYGHRYGYEYGYGGKP